jgi:hypothetical protein
LDGVDVDRSLGRRPGEAPPFSHLPIELAPIKFRLPGVQRVGRSAENESQVRARQEPGELFDHAGKAGRESISPWINSLIQPPALDDQDALAFRAAPRPHEAEQEVQERNGQLDAACNRAPARPFMWQRFQPRWRGGNWQDSRAPMGSPKPLRKGFSNGGLADPIGTSKQDAASQLATCWAAFVAIRPKPVSRL